MTRTRWASLEEVAATARRWSLEMIHAAGSGHPGGCLSAADLLTYLFCAEMNYDPQRPDWPWRDRFVLSKGHACPALYAIAAKVGIIAPEQMREFRKIGGRLQGHPHVLDTPWVETSTGSLGQGFSVAVGMAIGLRYRGVSSRVYVMLGDGEMQEGEVWEAAMCAAHYRLGNLCAIVDYNKMQSDATNEQIMGLEPLGAKWRAFNWHTLEIDGHDFEQIEGALRAARAAENRPTVIVAHTVKGKGVSFMEGVASWHGSSKIRDDELARALAELLPAVAA